MQKHILVTGHPRSGTDYMAQLLQQMGYDVQHEQMGADGTSNWGYAVRHLPFAHFDNLHRGEFTFVHHIQVVRDPVKAVASIVFTEQASEKWRSKFIVMFGNDIQRAVMSYIGWNRLIYAQSPTIITPLESANVTVPKYFDKPSVDFTKHTNQRPHQPLSYTEIMTALDTDLQPIFKNFCKWYSDL